MKIASRILFAVACVISAASVLLAAYVAHKGTDLPVDAVKSLQSAIQLQQFHALALLIVAWMGTSADAKKIHLIAGIFFTAGLLMFSVNIELIHLANVTWFRAATPYGGMAFVAGWLSLALASVLKD